MNTDTCMVEAVVANGYDADGIAAMFEEDPKALSPKVYSDDVETKIVCGFHSKGSRQAFVGKVEKAFPKMVSWR